MRLYQTPFWTTPDGGGEGDQRRVGRYEAGAEFVQGRAERPREGSGRWRPKSHTEKPKQTTGRVLRLPGVVGSSATLRSKVALTPVASITALSWLPSPKVMVYAANLLYFQFSIKLVQTQC